MRARHMIAGLLALLPIAASAAETVSYSYDAKGRLTQVAHAGGPVDGQISTYRFDAADNRTQAEVAGAPGNLIVVPLNGFTLIHPSG